MPCFYTQCHLTTDLKCFFIFNLTSTKLHEMHWHLEGNFQKGDVLQGVTECTENSSTRHLGQLRVRTQLDRNIRFVHHTLCLSSQLSGFRASPRAQHSKYRFKARRDHPCLHLPQFPLQSTYKHHPPTTLSSYNCVTQTFEDFKSVPKHEAHPTVMPLQISHKRGPLPQCVHSI